MGLYKMTHPRLGLDELDLKLAGELEANARQTTRDLAAKLGVSATTVSTRIRRMTEDGTLIFCAICDPQSLGYQIRVIFGLNVMSGKSTDVEKGLAKCKGVQMTSLTTGRYDLVISVDFRNNLELLGWLTDELAGFPEVTKIEEMTILKVVKSNFMFLHGEGGSGKDITSRNLNAEELKLVKALELNPRESIGVLGKKIGMSRWAAAHTFEGLVEEGLVKTISVIDPAALGLALRAYVFLVVRRDRIIPIAHTLADNKRIPHVAIVTGRFNIVINTAFSDLEEMTHFLTHDVGNIPGVIGYETVIHISRRRLFLSASDQKEVETAVRVERNSSSSMRAHGQ